MAGYYQPSMPVSTSYLGLPQLFGYVNADGSYRGTNCGLAASATLLTYRGSMQPALTPEPFTNPNMAVLESSFPPNILCGLAGTSRGRVERILEAQGYEAVEVDGEAALRQALSRGEPVAVMLQVAGSPFMGLPMPAGHWMVAYGCDENRIYLTNWHDTAMPWEEFRQGWSAVIPWCINMQRKGLLARQWR